MSMSSCYQRLPLFQWSLVFQLGHIHVEGDQSDRRRALATIRFVNAIQCSLPQKTGWVQGIMCSYIVCSISIELEQCACVPLMEFRMNCQRCFVSETLPAPFFNACFLFFLKPDHFTGHCISSFSGCRLYHRFNYHFQYERGLHFQSNPSWFLASCSWVLLLYYWG